MVSQTPPNHHNHLQPSPQQITFHHQRSSPIIPGPKRHPTNYVPRISKNPFVIVTMLGVLEDGRVDFQGPFMHPQSPGPTCLLHLPPTPHHSALSYSLLSDPAMVALSSEMVGARPVPHNSWGSLTPPDPCAGRHPPQGIMGVLANAGGPASAVAEPGTGCIALGFLRGPVSLANDSGPGVTLEDEGASVDPRAVTSWVCDSSSSVKSISPCHSAILLRRSVSSSAASIDSSTACWMWEASSTVT